MKSSGVGKVGKECGESAENVMNSGVLRGMCGEKENVMEVGLSGRREGMAQQAEAVKRGDAYGAVRMVYEASPGRSWQRLNGALADTLMAAITAHLSFEPGDFSGFRKMSGHYWMGNSHGGECGERFYVHAVKVGHTPACISFEKYAGRPAALWAEEVKTPGRLCIGSEFTWDGLRVTVSNMMQDYLVACTYGDYEGGGDKEGDTCYFGRAYRTINRISSTDSGDLLLRLSAPVAKPSRKPTRIIKIRYEELAAKRKVYEKQRKEALAEIAAAEDAASLHAIAERLSSMPRATFRHFDIEDIRKAIEAKKGEFKKEEVEAVERLAESEALEMWLAGKDIRRWFKSVRLRVKGEYVETSTGQSVTLKSAVRLLPWVLSHKGKEASVSERIDVHDITRFSLPGVQIGCTLIPWPEVERLRDMIAAAAA